MSYPQVIIPPSVRPVSPTEPQLIDDQSVPFVPRFARGATQRQIWGDPVWGWKLRFDKAAGADRALLRQALLEACGKAANILMTPGLPLRNSATASYWEELLTNNDFSNGTTGLGVFGTDATLSVTDRVLRVLRTSSAANPQADPTNPTVTQYAPYALRGFFGAYRGSPTLTALFNGGAQSTAIGPGLVTASGVALSTTTTQLAFYDAAATGGIAGDYFDLSWSSLARCMQVDNGPNALLYSDQLDNGAWLLNAATISSNNDVCPDGTSTADALVEDGATAMHYVYQNVTVSASANDYTFSAFVKQKNRSWSYLQIIENTGSTAVYSFFNLATGATGTSAAGANWSNLRRFVVNCGNGWYRLILVARKTNAATSLSVIVGGATADNVSSFAGGSFSAVTIWRASLAQSSVPVRAVQTTSAATTGSAQVGSQIYVKGLPASTSGLLLAGDFIDINVELKQLTASLDSDAAQLGVLQFRSGLIVSPSDSDPINVHNPFGRFYLASDPRIVEHYGLYTDVELDLIESVSA